MLMPKKVKFRKQQRGRRRGLATLHVHLAGGAVTVPFVQYAAAARLRDYVLYRVETSGRAWH